MGRTRASLALKRWLSTANISQGDFASMVTTTLNELGVSLERPVNQSTVSSWSRGKYPPGSQFMLVIDRITGIPVADWLIRVSDDADESGDHEAVSDTDAA